jgi:hypothetical protein
MAIPKRKSSKKVEEIQDTEEETESEGDDDDAETEWEAAEEDVADLVDSMKRKLAQINPGIGDQITLARFVRFVESNSTAL